MRIRFAGLAIAPGPVMVPVMSFLAAGRLIGRYGPAVVISLGSVCIRRRRDLVGSRCDRVRPITYRGCWAG